VEHSLILIASATKHKFIAANGQTMPFAFHKVAYQLY